MCKPVLFVELDVEAVEGVGRDRGVAAVFDGVLAVPEDDISILLLQNNSNSSGGGV